MPSASGPELLHAPWSQGGFEYVVAILVILAAASAVGLAIVTRRKRGGASASTLWARWGTWMVLASAFTSVVFSGLLPVAMLLALFALQGSREWGSLLELPLPHRVILAADALLAIALSLWGSSALLASVPLLLLAAMLQPVLGADVRRGMRDLAFGALGFAYIPLLLAFGVLLVGDRASGAALLFVTAAAAAFSDIGAYICGKTFGRHPLAPTLSPNKTVEGVAGNFLGAVAAWLLFLPILPGLTALTLVLAGIVVAVAAVWGDLFKSALKREVGVKDAGNLLPGFGGLLDRIDSYIVAVPLIYYASGVAAAAGIGLRAS
jgi:phosphatidate cytidylyltransferase